MNSSISATEMCTSRMLCRLRGSVTPPEGAGTTAVEGSQHEAPGGGAAVGGATPVTPTSCGPSCSASPSYGLGCDAGCGTSSSMSAARSG